MKTNGQNFEISKFSSVVNGTGLEAYLVTGPKLAIDLGSGKLLSLYADDSLVLAQGNTITAAGVNVFFSGATTGNNTTIAVGSGSFTWVKDNSATTTDQIIQNSSSLTDLGLNNLSYGGTVGSGTRTIAGLTVKGSSDSAITGMGVKYGGAVTITGVTSASAAGSLRYIEGVGIGVLTTASAFNGSLTLVSNGAGINYNDNMLNVTRGIVIHVGLTVGSVGDGKSDLSLVQQGNVAGAGVLVAANLLARRDLSILASGTPSNSGIQATGFTLEAGRDISLVSSGKIGTGTNAFAILLQSSILSATGSISLVQLGTASAEKGIQFNANAAAGVSLTAGAGKTVSLTAKSGITLVNTDNFVVSGASRLELDLGSSTMTSINSAGGLATGSGHTLSASGMAVTYSGATTGNNATIAVGSGSFTFVSDKSAVTDLTTIGASTSLADLGLGSVSYSGASGARTLGGLTITGSNDALIQGIGVKYGGVVTIDGITTAGATPSPARNLNYIEGTGIGVVNSASSFTRQLTLVSNGSGYRNSLTSTDPVDGIVIGASLTLGTTGDLVSHLTLLMSNQVTGRGILVAEGATVTAGGDINMSMTGTTYGTGILIQDNLTAGGAMNLTHSGSSRRYGFYLIGLGTSQSERELHSTGNMTLTLTASSWVGEFGFVVEGKTLRSGGDLTLVQEGISQNYSYSFKATTRSGVGVNSIP
ncbi:MAG: hypothetical protein ORO03_07330, partial [Alphaproteobacteria bacterium]|nr:hypothetical protein [Alphaproteobacteria bacterium]